MNKVGLVLSGGGAKGFAHIALIKFLDKHNLQPNCISGCSMGSIIGALYCLGHTGQEIEGIMKTFTLKKILSIPLNYKVNSNLIENYLNDLFENKNFEDLKIPLYVNAIDINTGEEIIFNKGNLSKAVRASIAIPGIFRPMKINDRILVDGGVRNNIPVDILKQENLDKIITLNVGSSKLKGTTIESVGENTGTIKTDKTIKTLSKALLIMQSNDHIVQYAKENSDIFINPDLRNYNLMEFHKYKKIIEVGEKEVSKYSKEIISAFKYGKIRKLLKRTFK